MTYVWQNKKWTMHITPWTTLALWGTNVYKKIVWPWSDWESNRFTIDDTNDRLVYDWDSGVHFHFVGISDLSSDKVSTITYWLFVNGSLLTGQETSVSFSSANKPVSISTIAIVNLNKNDYIEIWVKSDTASTTLTFNQLVITAFWER